MLDSVAQSDVGPTGDQEVAGFIPAGSGNFFPGEINGEIFSTVILYIPLIQETCPGKVWLANLLT